MKVPRVELHMRHKMCNMAFVQAVRHRMCMPRSFFIPFTHRCAVTGYNAAERPKQFTRLI